MPTQRICVAGTASSPLLNPLAIKYQPFLNTIYDKTIVVVPFKSDKSLVKTLKRLGVDVILQKREGLGYARKEAIQQALEGRFDYIHFCDYDRILHWAKTYPEELRHIIEQAPKFDFIIFGRTLRAFLSHPPVQVLFETLTNLAYFIVAHDLIDITAMSRAMSHEVARFLVRNMRSQVFSCATDSELPILVKRLVNYLQSEQRRMLKIGYVTVEGLEYEDADRYLSDIAKFSISLMGWKIRMSYSPRVWKNRAKHFFQISSAAIQTKKRTALEAN